LSDETAATDHVTREILPWVTRNWKSSRIETHQIWNELGEFWGAQIDIGFVLSQEVIDDPVGLLSLEIQPDLEAAILLAISGFYRHATLILRSMLDLAFASVWFSFNRDEFDQWWKGDQAAPFQHRGIMGGPMLTELMNKNSSLRKAEEKFHLVERGMRMHLDLSDYVHTKGEKAMDISHRNDTVPHYYPEELKAWFERFREVFEIWVVLVFARYPRLLTMKQYPKEMGDIMATLSGETKVKLEELKEP
jgi:hypothetical protein